MNNKTFGELGLDQVRRHLVGAGADRLYAKFLAPNDNSKNQPYFGGDFSVLNILPAGKPEASNTGTYDAGIFKATLNLAWLGDDGTLSPAPNAKLILYPQYPEVRFSGYLARSPHAPSIWMGSTRIPNRLLLMGVTRSGQIIGYAAGPESRIANEVRSLKDLQSFGVFLQIPLGASDSAAEDRRALLMELCRIAQSGWIESRRLSADGQSLPCRAPNCGGYTLEAELGITPNGYSDPDYRGWEVKQHAVNDFVTYRGGVITLMTPEPTAGLYKTDGVVSFVREFGYEDPKRSDRMNFGGTHRSGAVCEKTGLTLTLLGYDPATRRIIEADGGISLVDGRGRAAATWLYADLLAHWNRKHAIAAYIPSISRAQVNREYRYASRVRLGTGTDFSRFLDAVFSGKVYYDPGIKVENYASTPRTKRRSQFRIKSVDLPGLYDNMEIVDACETG